MPRPKAEINVKRCERLKQIIKEQGIKQTELSEETGISQQSISAMVQGKANVTEATAEIMADKFPQYSVAWLLGLTDYKNNAEEFKAAVSQMKHEGYLLAEGLSSFAQLANYQIKLCSPASSAHGKIAIEDALEAVREGYIISHNHTSIQLSLEEMSIFENEVLDFVELQLKHLFKRKGISDNG